MQGVSDGRVPGRSLQLMTKVIPTHFDYAANHTKQHPTRHSGVELAPYYDTGPEFGPDLTNKNACTTLHISNCPLPNQTITRDGAEWQKMAQIEENFLEIPALSIRQLTSSPSFCNAIQLYNNDGNATKCNAMQQIYRKHSG